MGWDPGCPLNEIQGWQGKNTAMGTPQRVEDPAEFVTLSTSCALILNTLGLSGEPSGAPAFLTLFPGRLRLFREFPVLCLCY